MKTTPVVILELFLFFLALVVLYIMTVSTSAGADLVMSANSTIYQESMMIQQIGADEAIREQHKISIHMGDEVQSSKPRIHSAPVSIKNRIPVVLSVTKRRLLKDSSLKASSSDGHP
ncbi:hypothetical protein FQR65_LT03848 [Abscondita terminalis]|nr:hypothetical protein FQR65_LT03848 [Abscondita terminalis]